MGSVSGKPHCLKDAVDGGEQLINILIQQNAQIREQNNQIREQNKIIFETMKQQNEELKEQNERMLNTLARTLSIDKSSTPTEIQEYSTKNERFDEKYDVFLSHKKNSAGESAMILKLVLDKVLSEKGLEIPRIFLDSNNLEDLETLKEHVRTSSNILVLLSKGVVESAWCQVEVYTAFKSGINVQTAIVESTREREFDFKEASMYVDSFSEESIDEDHKKILIENDVPIDGLKIALQKLLQIIAKPFRVMESEEAHRFYAHSLSSTFKFDHFSVNQQLEERVNKLSASDINKMMTMHAPMKLVTKEKFISFGTIAEYKDAEHVNLDVIQDRSKCFIVFFSHIWLRSRRKGASISHPDNEDNLYYTHIVRGLQQLQDQVGHNIQIYIFMDYCCIIQNPQNDFMKELMTKQINSLSAYVMASDCVIQLFTDQIFQHKDRTTVGQNFYGPFSNMQGFEWTARFEAFSLSNVETLCCRGWNRLIFCVGGIAPLTAGSFCELNSHLSNGKRMLFLLGDHNNSELFRLPPFTKVLYEKLNPVEGFLTREDDRPTIAALMKSFEKLIPSNSFEELKVY